MRILTVITGIILILTSIWCFANPGALFSSMAFILGCTMVFAGVAGVCAFLFSKIKLGGAGWFLAESILTFILGCIVLSNQLAVDSVIPLFFGMWILFAGVTRTVVSFSLKQRGEKSWPWVLGLGLIGTTAGIYSFVNPIAAALAIVLLVGIFFLIQGVNILTFGILMPGKSGK